MFLNIFFLSDLEGILYFCNFVNNRIYGYYYFSIIKFAY